MRLESRKRTRFHVEILPLRYSLRLLDILIADLTRKNTLEIRISNELFLEKRLM